MSPREPSSSAERAPASPLLVIGTGAMACAVGARLARAGTAVTVAGTWTAALEAVAARGIRLHEVGEGREAAWSAPASAVRLDALAGVDAAAVGPPAGRFPLALVLVKSHQTAAVSAPLARALEPTGLAVTLQNGLGNVEALAPALGRDRVAAGVAIMGARTLGPGEVASTSGHVVLGEQPARAEGIRCLAALLRASAVAVETTTDIELAIWRKLVANCAVNALTALHGVPNGALLEDPQLRTEMVAAAREVGLVAAARGLRVGTDAEASLDDAAAEIVLGVVRATAENRSSMLQDLERGARTEIDALNGALVSEGRRLGVPTPVNERLFRLVRAREGRPVSREAAV